MLSVIDLDLWSIKVIWGEFFLYHSKAHWMTSYLTSMDTISLSHTVFEIFDFNVFRVWPWLLTFRGHSRSKIFSPFKRPYMTSYLTSFDTFSPSRTVWPWPLTFRGHPRSNIFSLFEISYMTSYLTSIDTFSLSRSVFKIFDFKFISQKLYTFLFLIARYS